MRNLLRTLGLAIVLALTVFSPAMNGQTNLGTCQVRCGRNSPLYTWPSTYSDCCNNDHCYPDPQIGLAYAPPGGAPEKCW
jgi:hypothetical protein